MSCGAVPSAEAAAQRSESLGHPLVAGTRPALPENLIEVVKTLPKALDMMCSAVDLFWEGRRTVVAAFHQLI